MDRRERDRKEVWRLVAVRGGCYDDALELLNRHGGDYEKALSDAKAVAARRGHGRVLSKPERLTCESGLLFVRQGLAQRVLRAGDSFDAVAGMVAISNMDPSVPMKYKWEVDDAIES